MGKYQAYPEYKDSGFSWLGRIPSSWSLSKHKYIASFQKGKNPSVLLDEPTEFSLRYLSMDYLRGNSAPAFADVEKSSYVSTKGQVLIIWDGSNAGEFVKGQEGIVSSTMAASEFLADIDHGFYWYLCVCLEPEMRRHANGMGIPHVNGNELKDSVILLPSKVEQHKIANFLDHETAQIDTLIEKQQQLIKLLKESRKSAINKAVTQGINSNVIMRDSGIDWLGKIPKHWNITKAKYLFDEQCRPVREIDGIVTVFRDGQVCLRSRRRNSGFTMAVLEHGYQGIRKGDLVLHSMDAFAGAIGVSEDDGRATPEYVVTKPYDSEMNCEYYADILRLMAERDYIFVLCPSVRERAPRFRFSKFQQVLLPVPPNDEQDKIENYLSNISARYITLTGKAEEQINLLKERRTALISAAVTGKIDIRNWKKPESSVIQGTINGG